MMHSSTRSTFRTIGDIPIAMVDRSGIQPLREDYRRRDPARRPRIQTAFEEKVALVHYYPNMQPEIVDGLVERGYRGIVFAGTGLGHFNKDLFPAVRRAADAGIAMYMTVQTLWGYVQMYVYDTGRDLMDLGIIPTGNMLPETAYVKLIWALGQTGEAFDALERYRSLYPGDERTAEVAYQLGDIHDAAGRTELAVKEYETAMASSSGDMTADLHYRLGTCRETLGDDSEAVAAYKKAMKSKNKADPIRLSAVARCAAIYEKQGEYKNAIAAYRDLVENADDPELVVAAKARVEELEAFAK